MVDERELLRSVVDGPAPAPVTTLEAVLRRGRRRVVAQRAGAIGGAGAAVVLIGVAGTIASHVHGQVPAGGAAGPSSTTTASPDAPPGWTPVAVAPELAPTGSVLPPGAAPPSTSANSRICKPGDFHLPAPTVNIRPQSEVVPVFEAAVRAVAGLADVRRVRPVSWNLHDPKYQDQRGFVEVDVTDSGGTGSVQLEVIRFGGTPIQAADADAYVYGNCERPARRILADGTVFQLYPVQQAGSRAPVRVLRVYFTDGREYIITDAGYGSPNWKKIPGSEGESLEGGRGSVPLTVSQLTDLALRLGQIG